MASPVSVRFEGLTELGQALQQFPDRLAKKYLRRATFKAAQEIAQDASARAQGSALYPEAMQQIAKNIAVFARRDSDPNTAHYAVGVRRVRMSKKIKRTLRLIRQSGTSVRIENDTFFWHWFEFGTEERFNAAGAYRGKIIAQPFLRPAFEAKKVAAVDAFKLDLAKGVAQAADEVAR